ncbi:hypothetical protein [Isoptericola sp. NPDC056605]|uniref:hypothetical protein n=1 Tax=Isoptericola sp. NPDC056605 TaxID=3345876 RepID=UPI0036C48243
MNDQLSTLIGAALNAGLTLWAALTTLAVALIATYALTSALKDDTGTLHDTLCLAATLATASAPAWALIWIRGGIHLDPTTWLCLAIEAVLAAAALAALARHEAHDDTKEHATSARRPSRSVPTAHRHA